MPWTRHWWTRLPRCTKSKSLCTHQWYLSELYYHSLTLLGPSTLEPGTTTTEAFKYSLWVTSQSMCSPDEPTEYLALEKTAETNSTKSRSKALGADTLQYKLAKLAEASARKRQVAAFESNSSRAAWLLSNCSTGAKHSAYNAVLPKNPYFTFTDSEMKLLAYKRLYVDLPHHTPGVTKCCKSEKHSPCDSKGTQVSFCKLGGYQKVTHDSLSTEIQSLLSAAGTSSKREERDSFSFMTLAMVSKVT